MKPPTTAASPDLQRTQTVGLRKPSAVHVDMRDWPVNVLAQQPQPSARLGERVTRLFSVAAFRLAVAGLAVAGLERADDCPPPRRDTPSD